MIATIPRMNRLIVNHEEIKGLYGGDGGELPGHAGVLAQRPHPGDKIGFTIDAGKSAIVAIDVIEAAK